MKNIIVIHKKTTMSTFSFLDYSLLSKLNFIGRMLIVEKWSFDISLCL